jgi:hypothetical protein
VESCAPGNTGGSADGDGDALALEDGLTLADGETLADGLTLALGLSDGEADEDGLLMISRTAKWTIARSSLVPLDMPTERLPCPAVVSLTPTNPIAPVSMLFKAVELAPLVGSVWCPKCPKA